MAGDCVSEALEKGGESGWLETAEAVGQATQIGISIGTPIEASQVNLEPEHSPQPRRGLGLDPTTIQCPIGGYRDLERRRFGLPGLANSEIGDGAVRAKGPPVRLPIPPIHSISGATA